MTRREHAAPQRACSLLPSPPATVPDVYSQESGLNLSPRLAGSIAGCRRPVRLKVRGDGKVVAGE